MKKKVVKKNKTEHIIKKSNDTDKEIIEEKIVSDITRKRDSLIKEIKSKLMSNSSLKRGGPENRSRYAQEIANYAPVIQEINDLGRQIKLRDIGLGQIRG